MVDDQTATFHVQDLHAGTGPVNEDEYIAVLHVAVHQIGHNPAQGVETLPHVRGVRVDVIIHRGCQAEHPLYRVSNNNERSVSKSAPPFSLS